MASMEETGATAAGRARPRGVGLLVALVFAAVLSVLYGAYSRVNAGTDYPEPMAQIGR